MLTRRFEANVPAKVPVTILFGDSDNTLPADVSQERSLAPAHSNWLIIDNCGHAPMWDQPQKVMGEILKTSGN